MYSVVLKSYVWKNITPYKKYLNLISKEKTKKSWEISCCV